MIAPRPVKPAGRLVGVIADPDSLGRALRLRRPPDLFELRLDSLRDCLEEIARALPRLRAPIIITARHPAEGGAHALAAAARRDLLGRFLPFARYLDLELRSAHAFAPLLAAARRHKVGLILSCHDFAGTPPLAALREQLESASAYRPDIFKLATRTDTVVQLDRLLDFFRQNSGSFALAAMGMGRLGLASRRELLRMGSALNYAALGAANAPGQPTLRNLRRTRAAYII